MEWSLGAEYWSGVESNFGVEKVLALKIAHKIVYSMEWSLGAEYWSGVDSDFGVAKVEWSAVAKFYVIL